MTPQDGGAAARLSALATALALEPAFAARQARPTPTPTCQPAVSHSCARSHHDASSWSISSDDGSVSGLDFLMGVRIPNGERRPARPGDGEESPMSPRSPYSPYTPGGRRPALSMCSELDTIQSVWSHGSEEPTSPHTPSPSSVADLPCDLGFSRRMIDEKSDSYAAKNQPACCVIA